VKLYRLPNLVYWRHDVALAPRTPLPHLAKGSTTMTRPRATLFPLTILAALAPASPTFAGGKHHATRVRTQAYAYTLAPAATYALAPAPAAAYTLHTLPAAAYTPAVVHAVPAAQLQSLAPAARPTLLTYTAVPHVTYAPATAALTLQPQALEADPQSLQQAEAYAVQYNAFAQKLGGSRVLGSLISALKGQINSGIRHRGSLLKFGADLALRFIPGNFLTVDDILAIGGIVDDLLGGTGNGGGTTGGGTTGGGTSGGGTTHPAPPAGSTTFDVSGTLTLQARSASSTPPTSGAGTPSDPAIVEWQGQIRSLETRIQSLQTDLENLKSNPPKPESK
jgi:hypothetical protein